MYKHWHVEQDDVGVAWLGLDVQQSSTNVLSSEVLNELQTILHTISDLSPIGLAITSNKNSGFIAGADVKEFTKITTHQEALDMIHFGQGVINQLDEIKLPKVAVINGFCMGGGLELALACTYRIALDDPSTRLSLPEIRLGIHPGYGGTVRILRHANPLIAMDMMLTGRSVDTYRAKKIGLVDAVVAKRHLKNAARNYLRTSPQIHKKPKISYLFNSRPVRPIVAMQMKKQVEKKAKPEHYPAPYALINHWKQFYGDETKMLKHEADSVAQLSTTETAKNLVRVFMLQNDLKALATKEKTSVEHVHIIGAGVMGGDIATWCVAQGLRVTLQDLSVESLANAKKRSFQYFKKRLKNKLLIKDSMDLLCLDQQGHGLRNADVIIEAIVEDKDIKRNLYASIESEIKDDALVATNTSSIEIEQLCDAFSDDTRLVGLHFFNPVAKMPLVEIVNGAKTDSKISQRTVNFAKQIGKLPLPTKSSPGFLINRILTPYMVEAGLLHENGVAIADIDQAAIEFGMPMGPMELADTVGLDVGYKVAELLSNHYNYEIPNSFKSMVEDGNLGKKTGKGFYTWKNGKKIKSSSKNSSIAHSEIQERLLMRFLNETIACHEEKVVAHKDLLDAGIIFGTGFAPFRGGPVQYIQNYGVKNLLSSLQRLHDQHGSRFTPNTGWESIEQ